MPRKRQDPPPTAPDAASNADGPEVVNPGVNPAADHDLPDTSLPFPIVAIGASAGGIEAATQLLRHLPADTGMAYVVVQHLSPTHPSLLSDIFARATRMRVTEVSDDVAVEPNHVYVIPPNKSLVLSRGRLKLAPRMESRQPRSIDHFMRSLAEEQGYKSIGVVLSGTANDGTLGLEEIKAAGGITFAQDASAEQPSMPRSAIAAGTVDYVLPPERIAAELGRISRHPYIGHQELESTIELRPAFDRVLEILRQASGVDFGSYKRNTLHRRITRRMVLHKLEGLREYLKMLEETPQEIEALYQDVLINVTSFFRNPESFEALKTSVFPALTENRDRHEPLRVWTLGCSTGEEAYSIAMVYTEYCEAAGRRVPMQIFATDVNGHGIEKARNGVYTKGIVQDVSPERLRRFFVDVDGTYRITKAIRDMCVFARQNALSDPPFSRLDLICCRNMLIYLDAPLQKRLLPLLHYALRTDGFLFLGSSETIGTYRELFDIVDARHKIFRRRAAKRPPALTVPTPAPRWNAAEGMLTLAKEATGPDPQKEADRLVLTHYAPPGVLVNEELEVLQFRGDTGAYLAPAPGKATLNLLKMLREGLLVGVRGALHKSRREKVTVREESLRVRSNGGWREIDVAVMPVRLGGPESAYLVLFEEPINRAEARVQALAAEVRAAAEQTPSGQDATSAQESARLKQELAATREYLQSVIEQQEAANEELQSANEEIQSSNEELQSINEELETSKEEIQSANEELATVNDELQSRNLELSETNNDLVNLLASVSMAIVMLGPDLRIRRFTQPAERPLNLIHSDVGRPMSDIKLNIDVPDLEAVLTEVLRDVVTREMEVRDRNGRWYSLRVRPYRTLENKIDGAVMLLVDIDNVKRAEQSMRDTHELFLTLAEGAPAPMWVDDLEALRFVNRAFERYVGEDQEAIRRHGIAAYVHGGDRTAFVSKYGDARKKRERFEMRVRLRRYDGTHQWMRMVATPHVVEGRPAGLVGCAFESEVPQ